MVLSIHHASLLDVSIRDNVKPFSIALMNKSGVEKEYLIVHLGGTISLYSLRYYIEIDLWFLCIFCVDVIVPRRSRFPGIYTQIFYSESGNISFVTFLFLLYLSEKNKVARVVRMELRCFFPSTYFVRCNFYIYNVKLHVK